MSFSRLESFLSLLPDFLSESRLPQRSTGVFPTVSELAVLFSFSTLFS
nr:MAG TPA: hypothetical protein [Caudoviricetes sp.]DAN25711.1 MAG TPA: hypothetical protein [Bacteriophage sp.]DAP28942.1 MAG TPA: hypothetical protein [Caudoviricetes sp.]DAU54192.1 MAG TPA: hypothetical protein [Bacteriophage sp.]